MTPLQLLTQGFEGGNLAVLPLLLALKLFDR
jgi:hypothetical protein